MNRCRWALASVNEEHYHDTEWGVPIHDDRLLFEFLILEGAQAGLSWRTILDKRQHYRLAFDHFVAEKLLEFDETRRQHLLGDAGIVRNRLKIESVFINAEAFLCVQKEFGSFDRFVWQFVDGRPLQNAWRSPEEVPAFDMASERMSQALKRRGFKFVGPTICYAFMQAVGMVNDHTTDCFRYTQLAALAQ